MGAPTPRLESPAKMEGSRSGPSGERGRVARVEWACAEKFLAGFSEVHTGLLVPIGGLPRRAGKAGHAGMLDRPCDRRGPGDPEASASVSGF